MKKLLVAGLLTALSGIGAAWEPSKPITALIGNAPGSGNEVGFRIVSTELEKKGKGSYVVVNKPGMFEIVAGNHFATLPADGHTLFVAACQDIYVAPEVWYPETTKFNAMEFVPVAIIGKTPIAFWANADSKINTPEELIAALKKNDRKINFGVGGPGHQLAVEYLLAQQKIPSSHAQTVMYKGSGAVLTDVMGGHVEFAVGPMAAGWPRMSSGKLKLIGVATDKKLVGLEKYPLMKDTVPGLNIEACWAVVLPKGTSEDIQAWYRDNFVPVLRSNEVRKQFESNMIYTTASEHSAEGVRSSMIKLREAWQPTYRRFKPE